MRRLLVVGMANSPHLERWVRMVARADLTILIFPSLRLEERAVAHFGVLDMRDVGPNLPPGIFCLAPADCRDPEADRRDMEWNYTPLTHHFIPREYLASTDRLLMCIERFQPELLHSQETQVAGYLVAEADRRRQLTIPWVHSTWGSDFAVYGGMATHAERLRRTFRRVNVHLADCARDRNAARAFGYTGPMIPVIPASGGIDVDRIAGLATKPPSQRGRIVVKGYHNWAGRNLLALSALVLAAPDLPDYEIVVLNADEALEEWAGIMSNRTRLRVRTQTRLSSHDDVLAILADARMMVSLGISDGLATMVLEAMTLGAFPIQSRAGCAAEWFGDGTGGLSVCVNDTRGVADAILRAALDDPLVDAAASGNLAAIRKGWDAAINAERAHGIYRDALRCPA